MERERNNVVEYVEHMKKYLTDEILPDDKFDELIKIEVKNFVLIDGHLHWKIRDGITPPYLEWLFHRDFIQRMHNEYGYLPYHGITNLLKSRAWWPTMIRDIQAFV